MADTVTDDHGHEHPKHELSHYAKRIYAIRDLLIEKGVIKHEARSSDLANDAEARHRYLGV